MSGFGDIFGIHEQALKIRGERSTVLANNIANSDTPNFRAKDIDFGEALKRATSHMDANLQMVSTNSNHITNNTGTMNYELVDTPSSQATADGNTVDADKEKVRFTKNSVEYQVSLTFLNQRIRGLTTAIRGE